MMLCCGCDRSCCRAPSRGGHAIGMLTRPGGVRLSCSHLRLPARQRQLLSRLSRVEHPRVASVSGASAPAIPIAGEPAAPYPAIQASVTHCDLCLSLDTLSPRLGSRRPAIWYLWRLRPQLLPYPDPAEACQRHAHSTGQCTPQLQSPPPRVSPKPCTPRPGIRHSVRMPGLVYAVSRQF